MPKKKLVIFPFNGNGVEALDCIDYDEYEFIGFIDDDPNKDGEHYELFSRSILQQYKELFVLAVPGSPASFRKREALIHSLDMEGRFITAIHPSASIGRNVKVGHNCLIMAGVVLTSNAKINNHVCVLPNSIIHHDAIIHEYTLIGSNVVIAGGTTVGRNCYVGSGTTVINGIHLGNYSLIGLGSNVINGVEENAVVAGNPARVISTSNAQ